MWGTLTKKESQSIFEIWMLEGKVELDAQIVKHSNLRLDIKKEFQESLNFLEISSNNLKGNEYETDLEFGLRLYVLLNEKYNFSERQAADDGIWRYLSIKIIPDIVSFRWGNNPQRYFSESRRIWLKVLWWYVHLSWNENTEETRLILKNNTTDEIVQLVERAGNNGYRINLSREIMKYYGQLPISSRKRSGQLFRKAMKLNTARVKVIEPTLFIGGNKQYVKELFNYFAKN